MCCCVALLEANKGLRRPSSSRKQSVTTTTPPRNLPPNEHPVLTRSSIQYTDAYGGAYPAGGDFHHEDEELRTAHQQASQYAGSSGNSEMFSNVINSISQRKDHLANSDIDEQGLIQPPMALNAIRCMLTASFPIEAIRKHQETYSQNTSDLSSNSLGSAAAMQALKQFTQGATGGNQSQGAFLGLAMSEASKVYIHLFGTL